MHIHTMCGQGTTFGSLFFFFPSYGPGDETQAIGLIVCVFTARSPLSIFKNPLSSSMIQ